jgi:hypothetical protein
MCFLSSLCVASAHIDLLRGAQAEGDATLAAKTEVLGLIRNSTLEDGSRTSDSTFIAITQFLSCEAIYGDRLVLTAHINGLHSIVNMRGGLKKLGWSDELGAIAGSKAMILAVCHDFPCPSVFEQQNPSLKPHFPNLSRTMPESPVYWRTDDVRSLKGAKNCSTYAHAMIVDMKALTEAFLAHHGFSLLDRDSNKKTPDRSGGTSFPKIAAEVNSRLTKYPSMPTDPYYEIIRITSLIYATCLLHHIPLSAGCSMMPSDTLEDMAKLLSQTDLITCWGGDLTSVMFWCALVDSCAASKSETPAGKRTASWMRLAAMYCMILLGTEHSEAFFGSCRCLLAVQRVLRTTPPVCVPNNLRV